MRPYSPRTAPAASDTAFMASTGNTHGMRLRISPPRKARPSVRPSGKASRGAAVAAKREASAEGAGVPAGRSTREAPLLGHADLLADQPYGVRLDRRAAACAGGDSDREYHFSRIAVGDEGALLECLRRRPVDSACPRTRGELERQLGSRAGVSGMFPIRVPTGYKAKPQADTERLPGRDRVCVRNKRGRRARARNRRAFHGVGRAGKQHEERQHAERLPRPTMKPRRNHAVLPDLPVTDVLRVRQCCFDPTARRGQDHTRVARGDWRRDQRILMLEPRR